MLVDRIPVFRSRRSGTIIDPNDAGSTRPFRITPNSALPPSLATRAPPGSPPSMAGGSLASIAAAGSAPVARRSRRRARRRRASRSGPSGCPARPPCCPAGCRASVRRPGAPAGRQARRRGGTRRSRRPVGGLAVDDDTHLMPGPWQAVRALDVAQVPVFEHRVDPVSGRREDIIEPGPPAHFLADRHRGSQFFLGGKPPAAGPGNPSASIVERQGELNQVKHGLLDARPRWLTARLACLGHAAGNADDDPCSRDPPGRRDRDEDRFRRSVDEPVQLSCGQVTEHSAVTRAQHRRPQPRIPVRRTGENCVDAPVKLLPAPALKAPGDCLGA